MDSACDAFETISREYTLNDSVKQALIERDIRDVSLEGFEEKQVNEYIAKIDKLVDDLKMAGALLTSERELCLYVDQLPKELVPYRANIYQQLGTTNKEKMKVGLIRYCGMIRDGEDKDGKESGLATIDKQSPRADERKCYYCNKPGHLIRYCRKRLGDLKS